MTKSNKITVSVLLNLSDLSPQTTISLNILDNFSYQLALLIAKWVSKEGGLGEIKERVSQQLRDYNTEHLSGVLPAWRIDELVGLAMYAEASGKNNVGKNITEDVIRIEVKVSQ